MRSHEGMALEQLYRRLGYEGFELVKAEHDTWIEAQYTSDYNEALFHPLMDSPQGQHLDEESWKVCCQIVADYADAVPKWALNGLSAREAGQMQLDMKLNSLRSWDKLPEVADIPGMGFAIPHVAPDDPCPCGSGLRYCHCHGKYLS